MSANPHKGEAPLNACGRDWVLVLPFSAAKALKSEHQIDLLNDGLAIAQIDKLDIVLLAMLKKAQPDATPADAEAILDEKGIKPVVEAMLPTLASFMGVPVEDLKKKAGPADPQ